MTSSRSSGLVALAFGLLAAIGCARRTGLELSDAAPADDSATPESVELSLVAPARGSHLGGNEIVLLGSGFTLGTDVLVDGVAVAAAQVRLVSPTRMLARLPAHEPGTVDVGARRGAVTSTLPGAYTYEALGVAPAVGSVSGGLRVRLHARGFAMSSGDIGRFGGAPCTEIEIVSATEMSCRVPQGAAGAADVEIVRGAETLATAIGAFTYVDAPLTLGGVTGGAIEGALMVRVIGNAGPIADAYVQVGSTQRAGLHGRTGTDGVIAFESTDLDGAVDVHAAHPCYSPTSILGVNARTIAIPLASARGGERCPSAPGARPTVPAPGIAEGRLVWMDGQEFPSPQQMWRGVPGPRPGEERVAYVHGVGFAFGDPPTVVRVTEAGWDGRGFPFRLQSTAGAVRIVAIAGVQSVGATAIDASFVPYVVGASVSTVVPPAGVVHDVEVMMDAALDAALDVSLTLPAGELVESGDSATTTSLRPTHFFADAVIVGPGLRHSVGQWMGTLDPATWTHRLTRLPQPVGSMVGSTTRIEACWDYSCASAVATGGAGAASLVFLPMPRALSPGHGGTVDDGAPISFALEGLTPDLSPSLCAARVAPVLWAWGALGSPWYVFMRGDRRSFAWPSGLPPELSPVPSEYGIEISCEQRASFDFDSWSFLDLATNAPDRGSSNTVFVRFE